MKFRVNSGEMAKAITSSVEVATKNCIKDFGFDGLLTINAESNQITILSYGGTASSISKISNDNFSHLGYSCEESGTVTVDAIDFNNSLITMESGEVEFNLKSNELIATLIADDKSCKRSMGTKSVTVLPPNIGVKPVQSAEVRREVFSKGIKEVLFAPADEEKMMSYMCMVFETIKGDDKSTVRFSAGSGGRFAIKSIEGKNIINNLEDVRIILPKNNLENLAKMSSSCGGEFIKIETFKQDPANNVPEQIVVTCNGITLCLFGGENFSKYPNLTNVLTYKYPNRIYSDLKYWSFAIAGVGMTRHNYDSDVHNTTVTFDSENERFMVTPQTAHACTTPVKIVDAGECIAKGENIWFKCNSKYLEEIVSRGGKSGRVRLNFESQSLLDTIPDDKPKQMMPVLVEFPEKSDEAVGITENFHMFFTVSTK